MSSVNERKIRDVRDLWGCVTQPTDAGNGGGASDPDPNRTRHKYKTLERHLSMKKTIRKKMMRDLREIGDADAPTTSNGSAHAQSAGFLEQIKNDQPPPNNIDKPSLWKRLTKGWGAKSGD